MSNRILIFLLSIFSIALCSDIISKKFTLGVLLSEAPLVDDEIFALKTAEQQLRVNSSQSSYLSYLLHDEEKSFMFNTVDNFLQRETIEIILNITVLSANDSAPTVATAADLLQQSSPDAPLIGFIGASYSFISEDVAANVANPNQKPLLSFASTSTRLSSPSANPFFFSVISPDDQQVESIFDFCNYFEWRDIVTIHSSESYGQGALQEIRRLSKQKSFSVEQSLLFELGNETSFSSLCSQMEALGPKKYIIFIADEQHLMKLLQFIHEEKNWMKKEGYAWIFSESFANVLSQTADISKYQGIIYVKTVEGYWQNDQYIAKKQKQRTGSYKFADQYALYAYDAVLAYAYSIYNLRKQGISPTDGNQLRRALGNLDFLGASGRVKIGPNQFRISTEYGIFNIQQNGTTVQAAVWNLESGITIKSNTVVLPGEQVISNLFSSSNSTLSGTSKWYALPFHSNQPPLRHSHSMVIDEKESRMVVFGGTSDINALYNDVWSYSFKKKIWRQLFSFNDAPTKRRGNIIFIVDNYLYIFGGDSTSGYQNDLWRFDLDTQMWKEVAVTGAVPVPRFRFASTQVGRLVYIFGGSGPKDYLNDLWVYDPDQNTWKIVIPDTKSAVIPPRDYFCMNYHQASNRIVLWGGRTNTNRTGTDEMWTFSLTTNTWKFHSQINAPYPRHGMGCAIYDDKLYVWSGWNDIPDPDYGAQSMTDLHVATLTLNETFVSWTRIFKHTPFGMPSRDTGFSVLWNSYFLMFGGWGVDSVLNDLWRINLKSLAVESVHGNSVTPKGLSHHTAVTVGNQAYVFGGLDPDKVAQNVLYKFSLDTYQWQAVDSESAAPPARYSHASVAIGDLIYVFGGSRTSGELLEDLWVYSAFTNQWREITASGIKPGARAGHSVQILKYGGANLMVCFGGKGVSGPLDEMWLFDLDREQWHLVVPKKGSFSPAPNLINIKTVVYQNSLFTFGGQNLAETSDSIIYKFSFDTLEWELFTDLTASVTQGSQTTFSALSNGNFIIFAGDYYNELNNNVYVLSRNYSRLVTVDASFNIPEPRATLVGVTYANSYVIHGGVGAMNNNLRKRSENVVYSDVWRFAFPASHNCSRLIGSDTALCMTCSAGTYYYNGVCKPCSEGYYCENGAEMACSKGFYNDMMSASSNRFCKPCPFGTFSDIEGARSCKSCRIPDLCPIATAEDIALTRSIDPANYTAEVIKASLQSKQPLPYQERDDEVVNINYYVIGGSATAVIVMLAILLLLYKWGYPYYYRFDYFFKEKHNYGSQSYSVRRKTLLGGVFTIIYYVITPLSIFLIVFPYAYNNDKETRSLIPNLSLDGALITSDVELSLTIRDYTGPCVTRVTKCLSAESCTLQQGECNSNLFTSFESLLQAGSNATTTELAKPICQQEINQATSKPRQCTVILSCKNCYLSSNVANIRIRLSEDNTWATGFQYSVKTSSGYPKQFSIVNGTLVPETTGQIFRGQTIPTTVRLNAVQTTYSERGEFSGSSGTGIHIDYKSVTLGQQVDYRTFHHSNGVEFIIELSKDSIALEISRYKKLAAINMIANVLGSVTGLIGALAFILRFVERYLYIILRKMNRSLDQANKYSIFEISGELKTLRDLKMRLESLETVENDIRQKIDKYKKSTPAARRAFLYWFPMFAAGHGSPWVLIKKKLREAEKKARELGANSTELKVHIEKPASQAETAKEKEEKILVQRRNIRSDSVYSASSETPLVEPQHLSMVSFESAGSSSSNPATPQRIINAVHGRQDSTTSAISAFGAVVQQ